MLFNFQSHDVLYTWPIRKNYPRCMCLTEQGYLKMFLWERRGNWCVPLRKASNGYNWPRSLSSSCRGSFHRQVKRNSRSTPPWSSTWINSLWLMIWISRRSNFSSRTTSHSWRLSCTSTWPIFWLHLRCSLSNFSERRFANSSEIA